MSDTYIHRVISTHVPDGTLHHCGTISIPCEVECSMYENVLWCPQCELFWAIDEDCWQDKNTKWEVEKPAPQTNYVELIETKDSIIARMHENIETKGKQLSGAHKKIDVHIKTEEELRDTIRRYNELVGELHEMYGADNEVLNDMETRILGPME